MLAITDTSSSVKRSSQTNCNAEGILYLQKKPKSTFSSISSKLAELLLLRQEQIADDKHDKIMQLSIEEWKFKAETEWEEKKIGMLEQELTIKMEKLKAEAEQEWLNVDKECLSFEKEHLKFKVDVLFQRYQLLKEGMPKEDVDSVLLPMVL